MLTTLKFIISSLYLSLELQTSISNHLPSFPLECLIGISKLQYSQNWFPYLPPQTGSSCRYLHLSKWLPNPSRIQLLKPKILWVTSTRFISHVKSVIKSWWFYFQNKILSLFITSTTFTLVNIISCLDYGNNILNNI